MTAILSRPQCIDDVFTWDLADTIQDNTCLRAQGLVISSYKN